MMSPSKAQGTMRKVCRTHLFFAGVICGFYGIICIPFMEIFEGVIIYFGFHGAEEGMVMYNESSYV